ncbi:MAG: hypothetical protein DRQ43_10865 [Gammaproteobacteria bacterium]|nr:MAG: hypothetical protein DRQ43_10865 [Gammaproteobacteria bacterium]
MKIKNIKKQTLFIYFLSAFILSLSLYLSYSNQDWQWFSRSGSLIVILGIYLTSSQIIENSHRLGERRGTHNDGNFQRDWANDKQEKISHHSRTHDEDAWVMGKCGFNLLIIGTLIWGFGDLIALFT